MAKGSGGTRPQGRIVAGGRGSREWVANRDAARHEYTSVTTQISALHEERDALNREITQLRLNVQNARSYDKPIMHHALREAEAELAKVSKRLVSLKDQRYVLRPTAWPR